MAETNIGHVDHENGPNNTRSSIALALAATLGLMSLTACNKAEKNPLENTTIAPANEKKAPELPTEPSAPAPVSTEEQIEARTKAVLEKARYCQLTPRCEQISTSPSIPYREHTQPVTPTIVAVEKERVATSKHSANTQEEDDSWSISQTYEEHPKKTLGAGFLLLSLLGWGGKKLFDKIHLARLYKRIARKRVASGGSSTP